MKLVVNGKQISYLKLFQLSTSEMKLKHLLTYNLIMFYQFLVQKISLIQQFYLKQRLILNVVSEFKASVLIILHTFCMQMITPMMFLWNKKIKESLYGDFSQKPAHYSQWLVNKLVHIQFVIFINHLRMKEDFWQFKEEYLNNLLLSVVIS